MSLFKELLNCYGQLTWNFKSSYMLSRTLDLPFRPYRSSDLNVALHLLTLKVLINRNVQFKIYLCAWKVISHKSDSSRSNISTKFLITSSAYIGASREISSKLWMRVNGKLITLIFNYVKLKIAFPLNSEQLEFRSSIKSPNFIEICRCQPIPRRWDAVIIEKNLKSCRPVSILTKQMILVFKWTGLLNF